MTDPVITSSTAVPSRREPSTFSERGDAFLAWMSIFAEELKVLIVWLRARVSEISALVQVAAGHVQSAGGHVASAGQQAMRAEAAADRAEAVSTVDAVPNWAPGAHQAGDLVWSSLDGQIYRAIADLDSDADPVTDARWVRAIEGIDTTDRAALADARHQFLIAGA